jgi:glycosyltransferase involved in cell wall biosynthesis
MERPRTIGMIHYKTGGTDGVSLEMEKWAGALRELGHTVYLLGGEEGDEGHVIHPSLLHTTPVARRLYSYAFESQPTFANDGEFRQTLLEESDKAQRVIESFVASRNIDLVIPQNIWSVGMNPAVALAMERVCEDRHPQVLAQHHDFYWERRDTFRMESPYAQVIARQCLPPRNPGYRHVVINRQGHDTLLQRTGLESTVVPNVFRFDGPRWTTDRYNSDMKEALGLTDKDIVLLQATRIVERKGIEIAIDLAAWLEERKASLQGKQLYDGRTIGEDSSFTVVLAGYGQDDGTGTYLRRLERHARNRSVKLVCAGPRISHDRGSRNGRKTYSFWDSYTLADLVTYPSYWEGWGNQFLEGIFARVPMAVFEYPVFLTDIKPVGYRYASLGPDCRKGDDGLVQIDGKTMDRAGGQVLSYLFDRETRRQAVERNFDLGQRYNSIGRLRTLLSQIMDSFGPT